MLLGHDPEREGSVTPLKAKVIRVDRRTLANLRLKAAVPRWDAPNSLGGGCHNSSRFFFR